MIVTTGSSMNGWVWLARFLSERHGLTDLESGELRAAVDRIPMQNHSRSQGSTFSKSHRAITDCRTTDPHTMPASAALTSPCLLRAHVVRGALRQGQRHGAPPSVEAGIE